MKTVLTINKTKQIFSGHQQHAGIYCKCPDCNGDIVYGMVSCSDGIYGCLVAHWNYGCKNCLAVFDISFEKDQYDLITSPPMKIHEEIGLAIINPKRLSKLKINNE